MLCHQCAHFLRSATRWSHPRRVWQLARRFLKRTHPVVGAHDNDYFQKHCNSNLYATNSACKICQLVSVAAAEDLDGISADETHGLLASPRGYTLGLSNFFRNQVYGIVKNNHYARKLTICFDGSTERVELGYLYPPTSCPIETWGSDRSPSAASGEDCNSTFELATTWLNTCTSHHQKCASAATAQGANSLPTRVIDVGPADGSRDPRLIEPGPHDASPYVALSHCWGKLPEHQKLTTTTDTKAARLAGIPLASMPQTFRDAVAITRKLEMKYLWIDSLCIVQDDLADWEAEAARMADVYRNAQLTVAASHSADSTGGCFSRAPPRRETTVVCLPLQKKFRGGLFCCFAAAAYGRAFKNHVFLVPRPDLLAAGSINGGSINGGSINGGVPHDPPPLPLDTRAWTLQERVLSPRFLSFERGQIAWSCAGMTCTSTDSQGLTTNGYGFASQDPDTDSRGSAFAPSLQHTLSLSWWGSACRRMVKRIDDAVLASAHDVWIAVVEDYSARSLTRESDRLIAVYGVADALGRATGDVYLAGLWRRWVLVDLMWRVVEDSSPAPASSKASPFAPSWSWAAAGAPVVYPDLVRHLARFVAYVPLARVVEARVEGTPAAQSGDMVLEGDTKAYSMEKFSSFNVPSRFEVPDPANFDHVVDLGQYVWFDPDFSPASVSELLVLALLVDSHPPGYVLSILLVETEGQPSSCRRVGVAQWCARNWLGRDLTSQVRKNAWQFRGGEVPFDSHAYSWYIESHSPDRAVVRII